MSLQASTEFTPQERGACHTEASTAGTGRTTGESVRQRLKETLNLERREVTDTERLIQDQASVEIFV